MKKLSTSNANEQVRRLCQEINAELDRHKLQILLYQLQQILDHQQLKLRARPVPTRHEENPFDKVMLG